MEPTEEEQVAAARLVYLIELMVAKPEIAKRDPARLGQIAVDFIRAAHDAR